MKDVEKVFKACSDQNRVRIIKLLENKKLCVCEMAFVLGISGPSVSRHLKKLRSAGIIATEKDSFWTNYYLNPRNIYAKGIVSSLAKWLNNDDLIKRDIKKLKKAKREKLCCT